MIDQGPNRPAAATAAPSESDGASTTSAVGVAVGGVLAAVASFLTWARISIQSAALTSPGPSATPTGGLGRGSRGSRLRDILGHGGTLPSARLGSRSIGGIQTTDGRIALALGIALIVFGVLALLTRWQVLRAVAGGISAALGSALCVVAILAIAQPAGRPGGLLGQRLPIDLSAGLGAYVAVAGGVVALVAGIVLFLRPPAAMRWEPAVTSAPRPTGYSPTAPTEPIPPTTPA
jgi:hypothetical protein